jgi:ferredoxin
LPELLGVDDWGYPLSLDGSSEPEVTMELSRHAERAVAQRPRMALTLVRRIAVARVGAPP